MVEIAERLVDLCTDFINKMFLFEIEWQAGEYVPIGKIFVAIIFTASTLYYIFDALGILDKEAE